MDPEILVADEPVSALDVSIQAQILQLLDEIRESMNLSMVFITHDFLEAIKMGDNIAIMKDGEISQVGTPEEIVANPIDQYEKDFTEDVPKYKVLSAGKICRQEICSETEKTFKEGKNCIESNAKIDGFDPSCLRLGVAA